MSRKNKMLRAFLHQNPDPTIEQAWDAAWEAQGKKAYSLRIHELEARLDRVKSLPDKWAAGERHDNEQQLEARRDCSDELYEALK